MNTCPYCGANINSLKSKRQECEFCGQSVLIKQETLQGENVKALGHVDDYDAAGQTPINSPKIENNGEILN